MLKILMLLIIPGDWDRISRNRGTLYKIAALNYIPRQVAKTPHRSGLTVRGEVFLSCYGEDVSNRALCLVE